MMKIRVRLFGTLGAKHPAHDPLNGFERDLPQGSNIRDLMQRLEISESQVGIASVDGRLVKFEEELTEGNQVRLFQPVFGG